jgi:organic hydroperoxide reductase OsmC/OhrA
MAATHVYESHLRWPTDAAQARPPDMAYSRNAVLGSPGKADIAGSAPTGFGGDDARYNPEELLLISLSECHMLTYLAVAARKHIAVIEYEDRATGTLGTGAPDANSGRSGKMSMQEVTLRPRVTVAKGTDLAEAKASHDKAHANCFIANSVNFPVRIEPEFVER